MIHSVNWCLTRYQFVLSTWSKCGKTENFPLLQELRRNSVALLMSVPSAVCPSFPQHEAAKQTWYHSPWKCLLFSFVRLNFTKSSVGRIYCRLYCRPCPVMADSLLPSHCEVLTEENDSRPVAWTSCHVSVNVSTQLPWCDSRSSVRCLTRYSASLIPPDSPQPSCEVSVTRIKGVPHVTHDVHRALLKWANGELRVHVWSWHTWNVSVLSMRRVTIMFT